MNIGINASGISRVKGGASFYIINITRALAAIDSENKYIVFCNSSSLRELDNLPENFRIVTCAPRHVFSRLLWEQTVLPFVLCIRYRINVLFSPNYTSPLIHPGVKSVVTIHDLSFYPLSRLYPLKRRLFKPIIRFSVTVADRVIAVSEYTKKDILKYVGDFKEKISVIYEAAEERFKNSVSIEAVNDVKKKFGLEKEYILFTGFLEPRKNLERLLEAFADIKDDIPHHLVITGAKGWWYDSTFEKVKSLGLADRVVFTGYVRNDELPALYAGATLFAFPSLYEGFGISVLEAICCGTVVLVSNNTSLPEVAGEAGVYVNPYDVGDISEKLKDTLRNPAKLKLLKEKCLEIREKFTWKKAGQETLAVLLDKS
jgi:glycosyltransferase involved in cell wall biosynthesis